MTHGTPSDEHLMGQVASGKRECMEPLVRRHASPLLTYIERMVHDRHRAEELFQEVFMAVWKKRKTYRLNKAFRPWLYAIATNRCRNDFRRARPPEVADWSLPVQSEPADTSDGPVQTAVAAETATLVTAAVGRLPEQQRMVVVLRTWNGLSFAEIAQIVGVTPATARSHMHHGLAGMRKYLQPRMSE